jgi:RNA polymerase sigma factor (sigma-70 family)
MDKDCTCPPDNCELLVQLICQGDEAGGRRLHEKFGGVVRRIVERRLGRDRAGDWDDACQEIFLRVFVKAGTWRGAGKFCHWLKVLAWRHAVTLGIQWSSRRDEVDLEGIEPADRRTVDPATQECFEAAFAGFPGPWQEALRLRSQGATVAETSERLDVSERTVKKWIAAMYSRLCECLPD